MKILQSFSKQYLYNNIEETDNELKNNLIKNYEMLKTQNHDLKNFHDFDCIFYDKGTVDSHNVSYIQNLNVFYSDIGTTVSYISESGSKYYRTLINKKKLVRH